MADEEQLRILKQGADAWNAWRQQQTRGVKVDLSKADLRRANLSDTNLYGADLSGADLGGAQLRKVNLRRANLSGANFRGADLFAADLFGADTRGADFKEANLENAIRVTTTPLPEPAATPAIRASIERIGAADTKDVQQVAAAQIGLLDVYRREVLWQSKLSFWVALGGSVVGFALFLAAVVMALEQPSTLSSVVPLVAGTVVQVVSGLVFYLYGKTSTQLGAFHNQLEVQQRYLLANSICESLGETERDKARAALIGDISRTQPTT